MQFSSQKNIRCYVISLTLVQSSEAQEPFFVVDHIHLFITIDPFVSYTRTTPETAPETAHEGEEALDDTARDTQPIPR